MTTIRMVGFTGDWPLPSPSPFCLKLETWLRMVGLDYRSEAPSGPPRSKTGKVPYILRDDGSLLDDSERIIATLAAEHGLTLDAHLTEADRAQALAIRALVEDRLYFATVAQRWLDPEHFPEVRRAYFGTLPIPVRWIVPTVIQRQVRRDLWGQGTGRQPLDEVYASGAGDIRALSALLGDRDHFFGAPSSVDAAVFGLLENIRSSPLPGPLADALAASPNLVAFLDRMRARYWGEDWPS